MPEVLDQKRACAGACVSICGQMDCLKVGVSGPCSWIMSAEETAVGRSGARVRRWEERRAGRVWVAERVDR